MKCPTEHEEQVAVIEYCDAKKIPVFAIPNGANKKSWAARASFKAEGLRPGVPDLMIPLPTKTYHGLFIEMKRLKKTYPKISEEQRDWNVLLNKNGYCAMICYGAAEAIKCIEMYLNDEIPKLFKKLEPTEYGTQKKGRRMIDTKAFNEQVVMVAKGLLKNEINGIVMIHTDTAGDITSSYSIDVENQSNIFAIIGALESMKHTLMHQFIEQPEEDNEE